jgi:hypothetical protein
MTKSFSVAIFSVAIFSVVVLLWPARSYSQEAPRDGAELTVAVVKKALAGWELFQAGKFAAAAGGGQYTDPDPNTRVRDFWSNGRWAMLDRDDDGLHETIFVVEDKDLVYLGCLDSRGTLVNPASRFKQHVGQTREAILRDLKLQ